MWGGVVFNFNDQLWKVGNYNVGLGGLVNYTAGDTSYNTYNPDGFVVPGGHPDGVANEEYFGLVDADRNPKQVYQALRTAFAGPAGADVDRGLKPDHARFYYDTNVSFYRDCL